MKSRELINDYLEEILRTNSASTHRQYSERLVKFGTWLDWKDVKFNRKLAMDHLYYLEDTKVAQSTIKLTQATLCAFYSWLVAEDHIASNPLRGARQIGQHHAGKEKEVFSEVDYQCLLKNILTCHPQWWMAIRIAWETGLRLSDIAMLESSEIDYDADCIRLKPQKTERYGKQVEIPISVDLKNSLMFCNIDGSTYFLPIMASEYKTSSNKVLSMQFARLLKKCGIVGKSFHSFRHTYCSRMLAKGMPVAMLSTITGQSIQVISKHYNRITLEDKKDFLRKMVTSS